MQHAVMIEAVENHMPEVIVIDEIGTELEAMAARTIAERGVQLIGTAHGTNLENLMMNPTLSDLIGGIQTVTLGDEEARRRGTQKSVLERKAPPTFDIVVEIQSWDRVGVHGDVAKVVDTILRGQPVAAEVRTLDESGEVKVEEAASSHLDHERRATRPGRLIRVYPFGMSRSHLEQAATEMGVPLSIVNDLREADALVTLRSYYRRKPVALRQAEELGVPIYVLKNNTILQTEQFLATIFETSEHADPLTSALKEAEEAIERVMREEEGIVELSPQRASVRRLQHQLAERYNLASRSLGKEPHRRVRISRGDF
jgi:hypothetical protein